MCPECLGEVGRAEWQRLVPLIGDRLRPMDFAAVAVFCACLEDWTQATAALKAEGSTVTPKVAYS